MRVVLVVVAALMTLGLAALGVVSAQKSAGPSPLLALAAHFISPAPSTAAAPKPADAAQIAQSRVVGAPVIQIAEATAVTPSRIPSAPASIAPLRVADNTPGAKAPAAAAPAGAATANSAPGAAPAKGLPACDKPGAMGLARIVEIDTTGGPGFGFEHFKQYDFLRDKEVVLTFDDGPWPENTPMVLKALTDECVKGTFFEIGEHATWHPEISKQVAAAGMTIGSHTWSHKDLARNPYATDLEKAKDEIEMGVSAVHMAVDAPIAPFFRFPDLQHPPAMMSYLGERNIATFSTDIDSRDFKIHKPEQVIQSVMNQLQKRGKGIILMHDFQHGTAEAMPELLRQLKAAGYKIVHMVPNGPVTTLAKYDDMVRAQDKLSVTNTRPESSVVKTIGE
jgi:peptidoglycan/xylan/chitin deacetylase (PgdA/CDA1 family)